MEACFYTVTVNSRENAPPLHSGGKAAWFAHPGPARAQSSVARAARGGSVPAPSGPRPRVRAADYKSRQASRRPQSPERRGLRAALAGGLWCCAVRRGGAAWLAPGAPARSRRDANFGASGGVDKGTRAGDWQRRGPGAASRGRPAARVQGSAQGLAVRQPSDPIPGGPRPQGALQGRSQAPGAALGSWSCNKYLKVVPPPKVGPVQWLGHDAAVCRVPEGFHLGGQDLAPQGFFAAPLLLTPVHSLLATPAPHTWVIVHLRLEALAVLGGVRQERSQARAREAGGLAEAELAEQSMLLRI
ncbi:hypothetical protein J1605_000647 [Eschrichtius robustus]|uniref:Uncharacterized protein n=1 Tax=Eschrichtius robustus TaxID=9764 RepID=A0AB34GQ91_ESCRO|nr:hypothetical protein J1605_000647 [Eschrichtius robustus]